MHQTTPLFNRTNTDAGCRSQDAGSATLDALFATRTSLQPGAAGARDQNRDAVFWSGHGGHFLSFMFKKSALASLGREKSAERVGEAETGQGDSNINAEAAETQRSERRCRAPGSDSGAGRPGVARATGRGGRSQREPTGARSREPRSSGDQTHCPGFAGTRPRTPAAAPEDAAGDVVTKRFWRRSQASKAKTGLLRRSRDFEALSCARRNFFRLGRLLKAVKISLLALYE